MTRGWTVHARPPVEDAVRRLRLAWRLRRPVPVDRPVVPMLRKGRRSINALRLYEALVAADLSDGLPPRKYFTRIQRALRAGLPVVFEAEVLGKRRLFLTRTGERVLAVVHSVPQWRAIFRRVERELESES